MRADGFTLLEVLVALTLTAFLAAALAGGVRFASHAASSGGAAMAATEAMARTHLLLRRELERAARVAEPSEIRALAGAPGAPAGTAADRPVLFVGTAERLSFLATEPPWPGAAGLYRIDLAVVREPDGEQSLRYERRLFDPDAEEGDSDFRQHRRDRREQAILAIVPGAFELAYFDGEDWRERWSSRSTPPRLVRLRVTGPRGGPLLWPDLVARPRIDIERACLDQDSADYCSLRG